MQHTPQKRRSNARNQWHNEIDRFCDVWMCAANRSKKTIRAYRTDLKQFARQLSKSVSLKSLRQPTIEAWVAKLQMQQYESSSIRRKLASLRAFYGYLVVTKRVIESPLMNLRIRLGSPKRLTRIVLRHDLRLLIKEADRRATHRANRNLEPRQKILALRNALIVRLLCATAIRVGELVALRIADVQRHQLTLIIRGKGNKERLAYIADLTTTSLLNRYMKAMQLHATGAALFSNSKGLAITTENIRQILRKMCKHAAIPIRITPHMLRHTAATALLENGADLRIVQEFLGHDSIRSTERYTHVAPVHLRRVLRWANPLKQVA